MIQKQNRFVTKAFTATICLAAIGLASCGKTVDLQDALRNAQVDRPVAQPQPKPTGGLPPITDPLPPPTLNCDSKDVVTWEFTQPDGETSRAVDLAIVMDESLSILCDRKRLAEKLSNFVRSLPPETDLRVGVIPAVGGASDRSGKLFRDKHQPPVLDFSGAHDPESMYRSLEKRIKAILLDSPAAQGEMGMYSFLKSLERENFVEIQSQGFYRDNAALAALFITDENDICFDPELNGYTQFPDFNPSFMGLEKLAYKKYCIDKNGVALVSPEILIGKISEMKGSRPFSVGGIIHVDPTRVPQKDEEAIGHGILEATQIAPKGAAIEVTQSSYDPELRELIDLPYSTVTLQTNFSLGSENLIDETTLGVWVDGRMVHFSWSSQTATVALEKNNAGGARSRIQVAACKAGTMKP